MAMSVHKHEVSLLNLSMRVGYVCVLVLLFGHPSSAFALCDRMFAKGRVGLWTKSDAVTYFNDLRLETAP